MQLFLNLNPYKNWLLNKLFSKLQTHFSLRTKRRASLRSIKLILQKCESSKQRKEIILSVFIFLFVRFILLLLSFDHMKFDQFFQSKRSSLRTPLPVQFLVVQCAIRVCVKQLEDLSCPPLVLLDLVCAEQSDAERLKLLIIESPLNFNIESRQYRCRGRPRIVVR